MPIRILNKSPYCLAHSASVMCGSRPICLMLPKSGMPVGPGRLQKCLAFTLFTSEK